MVWFHSTFLHSVWWFGFLHVLCLIEASHSFTVRKYSQFQFIIQRGLIKILSTGAVTWALLRMKTLSATNMESVFPCSSTYLISFNSVTCQPEASEYTLHVLTVFLNTWTNCSLKY
jgi:hypothetical protein